MYLKSLIINRYCAICYVWEFLLCYRSFTFRINNIPGGHILVMAVVLPVKLELSSNEIVLRPQTFLLKTCFCGTVRLSNHLNHPAQFEWKPVTALRGIVFTIRPAQGNHNHIFYFYLEINSFTPEFRH